MMMIIAVPLFILIPKRLQLQHNYHSIIELTNPHTDRKRMAKYKLDKNENMKQCLLSTSQYQHIKKVLVEELRRMWLLKTVFILVLVGATCALTKCL
jgi:hypothetical protein